MLPDQLLNVCNSGLNTLKKIYMNICIKTTTNVGVIHTLSFWTKQKSKNIFYSMSLCVRSYVWFHHPHILNPKKIMNYYYYEELQCKSAV